MRAALRRWIRRSLVSEEAQATIIPVVVRSREEARALRDVEVLEELLECSHEMTRLIFGMWSDLVEELPDLDPRKPELLQGREDLSLNLLRMEYASGWRD